MFIYVCMWIHLIESRVYILDLNFSLKLLNSRGTVLKTLSLTKKECRLILSMQEREGNPEMSKSSHHM